MSKGWQKPIRLINFGDEYSQENIIQRLPENQGKVILQPFQKAEYKPEVNKEDKPKAGGLYGLYLYYYYKLGLYLRTKKLTPIRCIICSEMIC